MKEELDIKENDIKDEIKEEILPFSTGEVTCTVYVQEESLPPSTVEKTCTVYVQEEDVKMDNTEIKGKY